MAQNTKYHIGKGGVPRVCVARVKCPYGGAASHFNDMGEAMSVADKLNKQLSEQKYGLNVAMIQRTLDGEVGECHTVSKGTEDLLLAYANLSTVSKKLENIRTKAFGKLCKEMEETGQGRVFFEYMNPKTGEMSQTSMSYVKGSMRSKVDMNKFNTLADKELYEKDSLVPPMLVLKTEDNKGTHDLLKKLETATGDFNEIHFTKDENGVVHVSEETKQSIAKYRKFKEDLEQIETQRKELANLIFEKMEEKGMDHITLGPITLKKEDAHTRRIVDTTALKNAGVYDAVKEEYWGAPSIRFNAIK